MMQRDNIYFFGEKGLICFEENASYLRTIFPRKLFHKQTGLSSDMCMKTACVLDFYFYCLYFPCKKRKTKFVKKTVKTTHLFFPSSFANQRKKII